MNDNYFKTNEQQDFELLLKLNSQLHWFTAITQTQRNAQIDALGDRNGKEYAIELKRRHCSINTYDALYIEDYKYLELMLEHTFNNRIPLYINFLDDAVVVYNLLTINDKPSFSMLPITSKGYEHTTNERRYKLKLTDAAIYNKDKCKTTN